MTSPRLPRPSRRTVAAALGLAALAAAGAAAAPALEEPRRATVEDMDMPMLQRNLLKIYVCGKESTIHDQKMEELRLATEVYGDPAHPRVPNPTPEQVAEAELRHKFIFNYLLAEKTNAVQMIHVIDRILGTDVHLAGEGRPERAILEKKVELIEIPKGTEIRAAARIIGEALGCPVRVDLGGTKIYRVWFTMGPTTGEAIVKQVCASQPDFDWKIEEGVLVFRHREYRGASPDPEIDEEERKAAEEERRKAGEK